MEGPLTATADAPDWICGEFGPATDIRLAHILTRTTTIAVVGASPNPRRPSHAVMAYLQRQGYAVVPVNPRAKTDAILDAPVAASLDALAPTIDLLAVFRTPSAVPAVVNEAIAQRTRLGIRTIWMQPGARHIEAARAAHAAGFDVVVERCLQVEHARLVHFHATDSTSDH